MSINYVEYHEAHAAVCVKVYADFRKTHKLYSYFEIIGWDEDKFNAQVDSLFEFLCTVFWEEEVQELGKEYGFSKIYSEGRGNGWAVPYPYLYGYSFTPEPDVEAESAYYIVEFESSLKMRFFAEGRAHAKEQAEDAEPDDPIVSITLDIVNTETLDNFLAFQRAVKALVDDVPYQIYQSMKMELANALDEFDLTHSVTARHLNLVYQERHYPNYDLPIL